MKSTTLFLIGGSIYYLIEIAWRGYSHISMFVVGGLAFLLIGYINVFLSWETPLYIQCFIATIIVLLLEFTSGCILNLWLKLNVWDYSNIKFNILGQICIQFSFIWYFLSAIAIILDDTIRWLVFKEKKPKYNVF